MFNKKKELPGKSVLAAKVGEFNATAAMPDRPLLNQIREDRMQKQAVMARLEREVAQLYAFERFMESHDQADALVQYFTDRTIKP